MMGIYKITNKLNGNCYVGQSVDIPRRWKEEISASRRIKDPSYNYPLQRAFRKYGVENFTFDILELIQDKTTLTEREIHYYNLLNPAYNQSVPNGGNGFMVGNKVIIRLDTNGNFVEEHISIEDCVRQFGGGVYEVLSKRQKTTKGFFFIFKEDYESGDYNITISPLGFFGRNNKSKKVRQYDLQGNFIQEFQSVSQATKYLNKGNDAVNRVCQGKRKQAGGYIWKYAEEGTE